MNKRKILILLLSILSLVGIAYVIVPLVKSMMPTPSAEANAIKNINLSDIAPGSYIITTWNHKSVIIFRPDKESIQLLESQNNEVWGPPITKDNVDSVYVYIPASTYKGCGLIDTQKYPDYPKDRPSGWADPCHMGLWDYAGRAFQKHNVPEGVKLDNLVSVQYRVLSNDTIQLHP